MITNIFHTHPDILGIQMERSRVNNSFEMHIALVIEKDKWVCKKMAGISGDIEDNTLVGNVIKNGVPLSEEEAIMYFVHPNSRYKYLDKI